MFRTLCMCVCVFVLFSARPALLSYYILYQEFATKNLQFRSKNLQMDVLGRVLVLSHKSGLSQMSWNALRPRLRPRLRPSQLCLPLSKMMNSYWHRGVEFSPAQHAASTMQVQLESNIPSQSQQKHESPSRDQQSSFARLLESRQWWQKATI